MKSTNKKLAIIQSNAYKQQLEIIQAEIDLIDDNPTLDDNTGATARYEQLKTKRNMLRRSWNNYRQRNGLSIIKFED